MGMQQFKILSTGPVRDREVGTVDCKEFDQILKAVEYFDGFDGEDTKPLVEKLKQMRKNAHAL